MAGVQHQRRHHHRNFTFDVNGTRYEVNNVTITQPASPVTGTKAASAYR